MMASETQSGVAGGCFAVGDKVQLATVPPGRGKRLRVGLVGEVVATSLECGWCSVLFTGARTAYPCILRPAHLRHLREPADVLSGRGGQP